MKLISPILLVVLFMATGCNRSSEPAVGAPAGPPSSRQVTSGSSRDAKRAEFLNRIRAADPRYQTIERALLNEQNELGIILKRDVDLKQIPVLMRSLLGEMAKEFPGQDLTIIAYTPTDPPRKIGTGRLNASTREMTYTPVANL